MWEIHAPDKGLRGHLFGTPHLCDAGCYPRPGEVLAAFAGAEALALELAQRVAALAREDRRIFVALGAAHRAGPEAVVQCLSAMGFTLRPVGARTPAQRPRMKNRSISASDSSLQVGRP